MIRFGLSFGVVLVAVLAWELRDVSLRRDRGPAPARLERVAATLERERAELRSEREGLRAEERRLGLERAEVEEQRREVEALLVRVEASTRFLAEDRARLLAQVARVYETMKPEQAAEILGGLDVPTSTEILRRMRSRPAARVLAALDPAAAVQISERMLQP